MMAREGANMNDITEGERRVGKRNEVGARHIKGSWEHYVGIMMRKGLSLVVGWGEYNTRYIS